MNAAGPIVLEDEAEAARRMDLAVGGVVSQGEGEVGREHAAPGRESGDLVLEGAFPGVGVPEPTEDVGRLDDEVRREPAAERQGAGSIVS